MTRQLPGYYRAAALTGRVSSSLCGLCRTTDSSIFGLCRQCAQAGHARPGTVGLTAYALKGRQSGWDMHRYKDQRPSPQALKNVLLLLKHGLSHLPCAGRLAGAPVGAVAVVPSRTHYQPGVSSPLQRLCAQILPEGVPVAGMRPAAGSVSDRQTRGDAFEVLSLPDRSHVLLIDDTWVSGATVFSATAALRSAGAARVSALVLARWLDPAWPPTQQVMARADTEGAWTRPGATVCPFTMDGTCP